MKTRSALVRGLALGTVAVVAAVLSGCSSASTASTSTPIWIWPGGYSQTVLDATSKQFPDDKVKVSVIGDDFKQKLVTTFAAGSGAPAITGVKGEDMPYFLSEDSLFTDLKTLGIDDLLEDFPAWKLAEATTADGKLIGIPTDIGPTGMFYRADVLKAAGLPSEPDQVAAATSTWDDYLAFGQKLKAANGAKLSLSVNDIFQESVGQLSEKFVNQKGDFIGDSAQIKAAWDRSVKAYQEGLTAGLTDGSPDWAAAVNDGSLPILLGAAWHQGDIKSASPDTSGDWRVVAMPGGPANIGGSFLTIPASNKNPQEAIKIIRWLLNTENQVTTYKETGNFPASLSAEASPELATGDEYFGGQNTVAIFEEATKKMPTGYTSPFDSEVSAPYYTELTNVESLGKDPDQAWKDAVAAAKAALKNAQ